MIAIRPLPPPACPDAKRTLPVFMLIGIILTCLFSACGPGEPRNQRYNLVLITIDALRADHMGLYGYQRNTTPNMDRFAREHLWLENFFTVVPKTAPAMASFFTGKLMTSHGTIANWKKLGSQRILTDLLPAGYRKLAFVNNAVLHIHSGFHRGFDRYVTSSDAPPETFTDQIIQAVETLDQEKGEPFFLWVHYLDPHGPYTPAEKYRTLFVGDAYYDAAAKVPVAPPVDREKQANPLGHVPPYQVLEGHDALAYYIAQYDAEIYAVDEQVDRLLRLFDSSGMLKDTIVVITADHGESLGENDYYFEHGLFLDDGSIRIPCIIAHPRAKRTGAVPCLADNTDILPTVMEWLNLPIPADVQGRSFHGLLTGSADRHKPYIISQTPLEYPEYREAIRARDYKFQKTGPLHRIGFDHFMRVGSPEYAFFPIAHGKEDLRNRYATMDEATKEKCLEVMDKIPHNTKYTDPVAKGDLSQDTLDQLKTLGYLD